MVIGEQFADWIEQHCVFAAGHLHEGEPAALTTEQRGALYFATQHLVEVHHG